jgi:hypothetical protein
MKQYLLKYPIWFFVLLIAVSCNDDDDNGGPSATPSASFSGTLTDVTTGAETEWSATAVSAELGFFGELTITANEGSDILQIKIPSFEVRQYAISIDEEYGDENFFADITSTDTTLYSYEFTINSQGNPEVNGGGSIGITSIDTVAKRFDGNIPGLVFYNMQDTTGNDRFILQNATLTNIPYTEETFDIGGGDDELSLSVDGAALTFPNLFSTSAFGNLSITGSAAMGFPSFTLGLPTNLSAGTYGFGSQPGLSATYVASASGTDSYTMTSGSLVVTSNANDRIEGTFSGTATSASGSVSITNGAFSAEY